MLCPFVVLPVSQHQVFGWSAEFAKAGSSGRGGSVRRSRQTPLSPWERDGSRGLCHFCLWTRKQRMPLPGDVLYLLFLFSWGGGGFKSVLAVLVFLSDVKYTNAASFGVFVYFVWSHPCWYLNTIGKQMANFELLGRICVCLCLPNSQTVNYRV